MTARDKAKVEAGVHTGIGRFARRDRVDDAAHAQPREDVAGDSPAAYLMVVGPSLAAASLPTIVGFVFASIFDMTGFPVNQYEFF